MNNYELTFLTDKTVTDSNNFNTKIQEIIKNKKGVINTLQAPKRINLAHLINGNTTADIITIAFSLSPIKIKEIEKELKLNSNILRYILIKENSKIKKPFRGVKKGIIKSDKIFNIIENDATDIITDDKLSTPKIKLEDLDEKLNEML